MEQAHGLQAYGTLLLLLAMPYSLPVPGVGRALSVRIAALALAMWRGNSASCLPWRGAEFELPDHWAQNVLGELASKMFERCVDAIPTIAGLGGRPRKRPSKLQADKGYDYKRCRAHLRQRGIASRIARRGVESSERLGKHRWVVERTHGATPTSSAP